ncbi:MAG: hypothetical protein RW306_10055 [Geobacteraceae bacterium]|nr:hypothetical protein [Geobacteraceae bacterium]
MKEVTKEIGKKIFRDYLGYLAVVIITAIAIYIITKSLKSALIIGLLLALAYVKQIMTYYNSARNEVIEEAEKEKQRQQKTNKR